MCDMAIDSDPEYTSNGQATMEGTIMDEEMPALVSIGSNVIITSTMHATVMSVLPLTIATDATITAANPWNQPKNHGLAFGSKSAVWLHTTTAHTIKPIFVGAVQDHMGSHAKYHTCIDLLHAFQLGLFKKTSSSMLRHELRHSKWSPLSNKKN